MSVHLRRKFHITTGLGTASTERDAQRQGYASCAGSLLLQYFHFRFIFDRIEPDANISSIKADAKQNVSSENLLTKPEKLIRRTIEFSAAFRISSWPQKQSEIVPASRNVRGKSDPSCLSNPRNPQILLTI